MTGSVTARALKIAHVGDPVTRDRAEVALSS